MEKIAVLGAGNGGCALAAHLSLQGHMVNLFEAPELAESFEPLAQKKEIVISGKAENSIAKLNKATTDIADAVKGVDTVFISVPAFGYARMSQLLVPFLVPGQLVVFLPGSFATFILLGEMKQQKTRPDITIAEGATLPYAARLKERNHVEIEGTTFVLPVGVFPATRSEPVIKKLQTYYPEIIGCGNVLDSALNNLNPMTHPAPMLLSTSFIEGKEGFYLYRDGITDGVKRVMIASDRERIALRKALSLPEPHYGYHQFTPFEVFEDFFGKGCLVETGYQLKGPASMTNRFITEDVPYGLVLFSILGKKLGVKTAVIDSIVELAGTVNDEDYWEIGTNLWKKYIGRWNLDKLKKFLVSGARESITK